MNTALRSASLTLVAALGVATAVGLTFGQRPAVRRDPRAAPDLYGGPWLNTKGGEPTTLASREGKPTLVAFWTFACSNCQANLKPYARILTKYRPKGVELLSVHTPEMRIERDVAEVRKHVERYGIDYPVLVDGDSVNWNLWGVRYWPTLFVLDGKGRVVRRWEGELNWQGAHGEEEVGRTLDALLAGRPAAL